MQEGLGSYFSRRWSSSTAVSYDARWRREDLEQRHLDNARKVWGKHADDNRQAVEEHAEYVRSMATLSALMSGFVNVAFVQFGFNPSDVPYAVLMGFGITNSLTMAVNICCMAICTLVLASIFRTFTDLLSEEEEAAFLMDCREFVLEYQPGNRPPAPRRNFRNHWDFFCRAEWKRAVFMFSTGIALFVLNTGFGGFIKFNQYYPAAIALACGLAPGLLGCVYYHATWMPYLLDTRISRTADLDAPKTVMGMPFDWHLPGTKGIKTVPSTKASHGSCDSHLFSPMLTGNLGWRQDMMSQRLQTNASTLWQRYVSKTRSEMEERMEQLRSFAFISGVLAGFAVASLLQLAFDPETTPAGIVLWFSLSAGITAACATCSMAMCSLMLMSILKTGRSLISEEEEADFMAQCLIFARTYQPGSKPPAPKRSFRSHWETRCEGEWNRAFYLLALGMASFTGNIMAGAWIKYAPFKGVSISSTVIMAVTLLYLVYAHARWAPYLLSSSDRSSHRKALNATADLAPAGLPFDWHQPPVRVAPGSKKERGPPPFLDRSNEALDEDCAVRNGFRGSEASRAGQVAVEIIDENG